LHNKIMIFGHSTKRSNNKTNNTILVWPWNRTSGTQFDAWTPRPTRRLVASIAAKLFTCFNVMHKNINKHTPNFRGTLLVFILEIWNTKQHVYIDVLFEKISSNSTTLGHVYLPSCLCTVFVIRSTIILCSFHCFVYQ